jgi:hypothetical protein
MDPYLEQFWGDIHHSLITYARDRLNGVLPGSLRARVEERVFVELPNGKGRPMYPDIRVVERGRRKPMGSAQEVGGGGVAVAEPLRIRLSGEPVTQGFIEIIDLKSGRRVVTVIEVLSPSNKAAGPGRKLYEQKQQECREGDVNLVEIDLLRAGPCLKRPPTGPTGRDSRDEREGMAEQKWDHRRATYSVTTWRSRAFFESISRRFQTAEVPTPGFQPRQTRT